MKLILCLLIMLAFPVTINADVLIEPEDNFYKWHSDECTSCNKYYTAAAEVPVYSSPDALKAFDTAESGSIFYIEWIYTDRNEQWGLYEGNDISYWVSMHALKPVYSHDEFCDDFESEIISKEASFNINESGWIILYEYPNSTWISDVLNSEWVNESSFTVHTLYTDSQGNQWGYIPYWMQHQGWINLSDPVSKTEPVRTSFEIYIPSHRPVNIGLAAFAVLTICGLTAAAVLIKKRRNSHA